MAPWQPGRWRVNTTEIMPSMKLFSLILFLFCSYSSFSLSKAPPSKSPPSKAPPDANSILKSFLECLAKSPQPDPTYPSIVYSPTSNSSAYTSTLKNHIKNSRYGTPTTPKPAFIMTPKKDSHVQAAVVCAKKLHVQMRIRSGGHDYEGVSYTSPEKNFMLLDMLNFRSVVVNVATETAVAEVGAQLGDLYYRIYEKSKVHGFPAGACPTVCIGGHISGGGYGTMLRKHGITVDHVTDAKIVDVNGKIMDRKAMGEDLFWAIRGGGGSSFGVIISFTLKIVPVPKVNTVFRVMKTEDEKAADIVVKWQAVMPTIDHDLFIRLLLQPGKIKGRTSVRATFMALFLGDSTRLLGLMGKTFPELGLKKIDCFEVSWIQAALYWANMDFNKTKPEKLMDRHTDIVKYLKRKSDYVQTPIPKPEMTSIFKKLSELGKVGLVFNPYGGRMSEVPADATPFPHRAGNLYKVQYSLSWSESDPKTMENNLNQCRVMHDFMTKYVSKNPRGAFLNYRDLEIGVNKNNSYNSGKVYGEKYFRKNFDRLVKVKTAVDPEDFFKNEQSIPVLPKKTKGMPKMQTWKTMKK